MTLKLGVAQFAITIGNLEENLAAGRQAVIEAAATGCNLVQLPELWISGYDLQNCEAHSHALLWYTEQLQTLANRHNLIIGGSYITSRADRFFNSYLLFIPGQPVPQQYDKTHLFRLLEEDTYFTPGDSLTVVDLEWGKFGLAICYDVRFPELIRAYTARGIDYLLVAAQWGAQRADHWRILLKARAIENQIFVAASNGIGPIHDKQLAGFSVVLDPWGNTLAEADADHPALITAELDRSELERVRQRVPSQVDQRTNLYQKWAGELQK